MTQNCNGLAHSGFAVICGIAMLALGISGCARSGDFNMANNDTVNSLMTWHQLLMVEMKTGGDAVTKHSTAAAILDAWRKKGMIGKSDASVLRADAWGRPLVFERLVRGDVVTIRVISAGANGLMEGGRGDDLFMELVASQRRVISARLRGITERGEPQLRSLPSGE